MAKYTLEEQKALKAIDDQLLRVADGTLSAVGFIDFVADIITESNKTTTAAEEVVGTNPLAPIEALLDDLRMDESPHPMNHGIDRRLRAALAEAREAVDALVKKWEAERESHTSALEKVMHLTERAEVAEAERARALVLMEAVLARVRCEAVHRQTNGGRCVNCILWAKNVGAPKYLAHFARGEGR